MQFLSLFFTIISIGVSADIALKKEWTLPNQFERNRPSQGAQNQEQNDFLREAVDSETTTTSTSRPAVFVDNMSTIMYKQMIAKLFERSKLSKSLASGKYHRAVHLEISEEELNRLETSEDPRDWQTVLSEVLRDLKEPQPHCPHSKQSSYFDLSASLDALGVVRLLQISEVRFTLYLILTAFLTVYLHRKFKRGILYIFIGGSFLVGFLYTYYECNRQLEIDELVSALEGKPDPCNPKPHPFFGHLFNWFSHSECVAHMRKKNSLKMPYCQPDRVMLLYANKLFFDQFQMLTENSLKMFRHCAESIPFPYNILAMIVVPALLVYVIKLCFQYILTPAVWRTPVQPPVQQQIAGPHQQQIAGAGDQLSAHNLALLFQAFGNALHVTSKNVDLPMISGVQDVPAALPAPAATVEEERSVNRSTEMAEEKNTFKNGFEKDAQEQEERAVNENAQNKKESPKNLSAKSSFFQEDSEEEFLLLEDCSDEED